jgi:hypothetical protein
VAGNDLDMLSVDIQNAYLPAPITKERLWAKVDAAFGSGAGRPVKIVRAHSRLKFTGA